MPALLQTHVHVAEDALRLVGGAREPLAVGDVELDRVHVRRLSSSASAVSMWSRRRSAMTTFIPAATNAVVMPSPIPLAPPVTNAVLPSTSTSVARPGGEGLGLAGAPALLDREPVGRHRLVGERGDRSRRRSRAARRGGRGA